jgi:hypothetical protein
MQYACQTQWKTFFSYLKIVTAFYCLVSNTAVNQKELQLPEVALEKI